MKVSVMADLAVTTWPLQPIYRCQKRDFLEGDVVTSNEKALLSLYFLTGFVEHSCCV
jgi:hypothetical protein